MKILLTLLALNLLTGLRAEDDVATKPTGYCLEDKVPQDPLTVRALERLEERLGIRFDIPFPEDFDCDAYKKQPLALLTADGKKICITRPIVNPFDEPRTVEWMMGPEDPKKLGYESIDCAFDLDERGEFSRLNLQADWASVGGNHLLDRGDDESGRDFFERARLTYRDRAGRAQDQATAQLYLAAFEKVAVAIQALRKEEPDKAPGTVK
ncbi:MAG: hypothetical protein ABIS50_04180 [Luteolibacter sp.]|uniref:hypothetical protein n=1 Tax=Luteolibacter sp. TaxID=1962973 RepID=UPI0032648AB4